MSDVIEIVVLATGSNHLLASRSAGIRTPFAPEKDFLELIHSGIDEEQRRVFGRNQRRTLDYGVPAILKVLEKTSTDFVTVHEIVPVPP
jgi:hypothetical protein